MIGWVAEIHLLWTGCLDWRLLVNRFQVNSDWIKFSSLVKFYARDCLFGSLKRKNGQWVSRRWKWEQEQGEDQKGEVNTKKKLWPSCWIGERKYLHLVECPRSLICAHYCDAIIFWVAWVLGRLLFGSPAFWVACFLISPDVLCPRSGFWKGVWLRIVSQQVPQHSRVKFSSLVNEFCAANCLFGLVRVRRIDGWVGGGIREVDRVDREKLRSRVSIKKKGLTISPIWKRCHRNKYTK